MTEQIRASELLSSLRARDPKKPVYRAGDHFYTAGELIHHIEEQTSVGKHVVAISDVVQMILIKHPDEALRFVDDVVRTFNRGDQVEAIDRIYDTVEELLLAHDYDSARWILAAAEANLTQLSLSALLSFLTVTRPWRHELGSERARLVHATRERVEREHKPEEVERFLQGLE